MSALIREFLNYYKLANDSVDQRTAKFPLVASPVSIIVIICIYFLFIKKIGPAFMKNRKPMNVDVPMLIYNFLQVLICSYIGYKGTMAYLTGNVNILCGEVDMAETPEVFQNILIPAYIYFLLKIVDLIDTVFFVLRKNDRQVTFLHVYHHTMMILMSWVGMRYVPGGHGLFLGAINSFVHVCMYAYYFLSVYNREFMRKNLWLKKLLTEVQLFQFACLFVHSSVALLVPDCSYPRIILYSLTPQSLFVFLLFWDFYKKKYLSKSKQ